MASECQDEFAREVPDFHESMRIRNTFEQRGFLHMEVLAALDRDQPRPVDVIRLLTGQFWCRCRYADGDWP